MHWSAYHDVGWTIVDSGTDLDPERYLGEFGDLPREEGEPGKWCDVVVRDSLGEMRWTFVLTRGQSQSVTSDREAAVRALSPPLGGRRAGDRALREWEREDEAAAASSAPFCPRSATGTDGIRSGRRLRLVRSFEAA